MGVPNLTRSDARARAELLTVIAYEVDIDLTDGAGRPGEGTFRSRTKVRFHARDAGASTFIDLIAEPINAATLNGEPLDTSHYAPETGLRLANLAEDTHFLGTPSYLWTEESHDHSFTKHIKVLREQVQFRFHANVIG